MKDEKDKVLLIDDDALVVRTLQGLLRQKGYAVEIAMSGTEGIEKAVAGQYDLIISDVRMPGLDGINAVEAIQRRFEGQGRRGNFMFITGYAEEDAPEHAVRLGVTDFLLKPFDATQFLEAVEKNLKSQVPSSQESSKEYDVRGRWQYPGEEFVYEKLVTLKETNMEGNVYFANYFLWQGEIREAMLLSHPHFEEEAKRYHYVKMITHSAYQRFLHESYLGDIVQGRMTAREIKNCSFILVFRFFNKRKNLFLAEGWQRIAFSDMRSGKVCTIPPHLLDLIIPIEEQSLVKTAASDA